MCFSLTLFCWFIGVLGGIHPTSLGFTTRNKKTINPAIAIIRPGTIKDSDQFVSTYSAAIKEPAKKNQACSNRK